MWIILATCSYLLVFIPSLITLVALQIIPARDPKQCKNDMQCMCYLSMCDHSMWPLYVSTLWDHSMWALYVWPLYVSTLCVTTLCVHSMCEHSMWALYVTTLCARYVWLFVTTLCVSTPCGHSMWALHVWARCVHSMCEHSMWVLGPDVAEDRQVRKSPRKVDFSSSAGSCSAKNVKKTLSFIVKTPFKSMGEHRKVRELPRKMNIEEVEEPETTKIYRQKP